MFSTSKRKGWMSFDENYVFPPIFISICFPINRGPYSIHFLKLWEPNAPCQNLTRTSNFWNQFLRFKLFSPKFSAHSSPSIIIQAPHHLNQAGRAINQVTEVHFQSFILELRTGRIFHHLDPNKTLTYSTPPSDSYASYNF